MGLVEYAASTCLAATGFALAAPFLETKVPAIAGVTQQLQSFVKIVAGFGIAGGALGILLAPLLLGFNIYRYGLGANLLALPLLALLLVGCVGAIGLGVVAFRRPAPTEPHSGELDRTTIAGFIGVAYGAFLWVVFTIALAVL